MLHRPITNDRAPQLPSNAENGIKLHTAPKARFMFLRRVWTPAGDPQRRYTGGTFHNDGIRAGSLPRVPSSDTLLERNAL